MIDDQSLSVRERLWAYVVRYTEGWNRAEITRKRQTIADRLGRKPQTVTEALGQLRRAGRLYTRQRGYSLVLRLTPFPEIPPPEPQEKNPQGRLDFEGEGNGETVNQGNGQTVTGKSGENTVQDGPNPPKIDDGQRQTISKDKSGVIFDSNESKDNPLRQPQKVCLGAGSASAEGGPQPHPPSDGETSQDQGPQGTENPTPDTLTPSQAQDWQGKPTQTEEPLRGGEEHSGAARRRLTEAEEQARREALWRQAKLLGVQGDRPAVKDWKDWKPPEDEGTPVTDAVEHWSKHSLTGRKARYGLASERVVN